MKFPNLTCVHLRETNEISKSDMCPLTWNQWNFGKLSFWKPGTKSLELQTNFEKNKTPNFYRVFDSMVNSFDNLWETFTVCIKSLRYSKRVKKKFKFNFPNILVVSDNPFLCHGFLSIFDKNMRPFLYPLKTSENCRWYRNVFLMFSGGIERHQ